MSEPREIHQIEYRWQPGTDMTPIASSMSGETFRWWTQRLGWRVRHPDVEAPTESVRYEIDKDGVNASLAWRWRDPRAMLVTDGPQMRPLVSRVLVGPTKLLSPLVAFTLCATGMPDLIGPWPGSVTAGTQLPTIIAAELPRLSSADKEELDVTAAAATGLELVIAAALSDLETPLAVELPERFISGPVCGGPQANLLWGLFTTLRPLLGAHFGRRTWSFSTFEPPLGDTDPAALGDIVFRATHVSRPATAPRSFRQELPVRAHDRVPQPETRDQELAALLVEAYRTRGGQALRQLFSERTKDPQLTTGQRVDLIYRQLTNSHHGGGPGNGLLRGGGAAERTPASVPAADGHASGEATVGQPVPGNAGQLTIPVSVPAGQLGDGTSDATAPATLSELVGYLSDGATIEFALEAMLAGRFSTDPVDRAVTRNQLRDHGWYVDTLGHDRQQPVHDVLVVLFTYSVLPDLSQALTAREVADWVGQPGTPAPVITALYSAGRETEQEPELTRILIPALIGRVSARQGPGTPPVQGPPTRAQTGRAVHTPGRHSSSGTDGTDEGSRQHAGKQAGSSGAGQPDASQPRYASPGRRPSRADPASTASPVSDPAWPERAPLTSAVAALTFLRLRIPVYTALLIAIGLMIVVLVA